jgi:hypothetical protein
VPNLRALRLLQPLRQRRSAVIVCQDESSEFEAARPVFDRLGAELVLERDQGPLSDALGRPSVTVCDRYLDVCLHREVLSVEEALEELSFRELACPECPQAADELL